MSTELNKYQDLLLSDINQMIEHAYVSVNQAINATIAELYWNIGARVNREVLDNERAPYGKQIIETLSGELSVRFGKSFELRNLRRMMQFAEVFPDFEIVSTLSTQLRWSHFVELLPSAFLLSNGKKE